MRVGMIDTAVDNALAASIDAAQALRRCPRRRGRPWHDGRQHPAAPRAARPAALRARLRAGRPGRCDGGRAGAALAGRGARVPGQSQPWPRARPRAAARSRRRGDRARPGPGRLDPGPRPGGLSGRLSRRAADHRRCPLRALRDLSPRRRPLRGLPVRPERQGGRRLARRGARHRAPGGGLRGGRRRDDPRARGALRRPRAPRR